MIQLLRPHGRYLQERGIELPSGNGTGQIHGGGTHQNHTNGVNYDQLAKTLISPDASTPTDLANAVFLVHEMSTPANMDLLIEKSPAYGIGIDPDPDPTPADSHAQNYIDQQTP